MRDTFMQGLAIDMADNVLGTAKELSKHLESLTDGQTRLFRGVSIRKVNPTAKLPAHYIVRLGLGGCHLARTALSAAREAVRMANRREKYL